MTGLTVEQCVVNLIHAIFAAVAVKVQERGVHAKSLLSNLVQ
jgi:hypothetical protein